MPSAKLIRKKDTEIDLKSIKRKVVFWTIFAIVVAYFLIFSFIFASNVHAETGLEKARRECNEKIASEPGNWEWNNDRCYHIGNHGCGADTYFDWGCDKNNRDNTNNIVALILSILNWASIGVTIAVVCGIIYGAVLYTSAGGKSDQAKKGIKVIRGAVIALLLYFAMFAIINFLVPGGLFNAS